LFLGSKWFGSLRKNMQTLLPFSKAMIIYMLNAFHLCHIDADFEYLTGKESVNGGQRKEYMI